MDKIELSSIASTEYRAPEWVTKKTISEHLDSFEHPPSLEKHSELFLHALHIGDIDGSIKVLRRLIKMPGGRQAAAILVDEKKIANPNIILMALLGDPQSFSQSFTSVSPRKVEMDGEGLLSLACEGGNLEIVEQVAAQYPGRAFFKKAGPENKAPIDYLNAGATPKQMLARHQVVFDACLKNGDLESKIEATRRLSSLPGGRACIRQRLTKDDADTGIIAALIGNKEEFEQCFPQGSVIPKEMLRWAMEGGNPEIINQVSERTGMSVLDKPLFGKSLFESLHPDGYSVLINGFENKSAKEQVKALRALLKLLGGKEFLSNYFSKIKNEKQKAFAAALLGDLDLFKSCEVPIEEFGNENLLHLACEGGDPSIILAVAQAMKSTGNPFLKSKLFGKKPIDYLSRDILSASDNAFQEYYDKNFGQGALEKQLSKKPAQSPIKAVTKAAQIAYAGYQRKARLGSDSARDEELIAVPSPFKANYAEKKAIYDDIKLAVNHEELREYITNNTFHFLGGLISQGEFELAKSMIAKGLFNEVSPRLLQTILASTFTMQQQFDLCTALFNHAKTMDDQVQVVRHLMGIPGGKAIAEKWLKDILETIKPDQIPKGLESGLALAALLGDTQNFRILLNKDLKRAKKLRIKSGQTLMHFVCEGNNAELIKLYADTVRDVIPNPFLVQDRPASWMGRRLKTRNRPLDMMTLEAANKLDDLYKFEHNAAGSFSMGVIHSLYVRTPMKLKYEIASATLGKFGGDVLVSAGMNVVESIGTLGYGSGFLRTATHGAAAFGEAVALNAPLYGGMITANRLSNSFFRRVIRKIQADNRGLDGSLSQFSGSPSKQVGEEGFKDFKDKPITDSLIRKLARIAKIAFEERTEVLSGLIQQAHDEVEKPEDGNKMVEALLESQLELRHPEINKAVASAIYVHLNNRTNPPSVGKLRSYMIAAARMGDSILLGEIAAKSKDPDSLWLDTFIRRKTPSVYGFPQLDRGNTLMHVAVATGDPKFVREIDAQWKKAYLNRKRLLPPGQEVTHRLPTDKLTQKAFAQSDGSGRMKDRLPENPWEVRNSSGLTPAEMLSFSLARQLDESYLNDPNKPGSLTQITRERLQEEGEILGMEVSLAIPGKIGLNLGVAHYVAMVIMAGRVAGAVHGGPVGAVLAGGVIDFIAGLGIMIVGTTFGFLSGKGTMSVLQSMEQSARGYGTEAFQMNAQVFEDAKTELKKLCDGFWEQAQIDAVFRDNQVYRQEDLARILEKLNVIKGFSDKFADKLSRMVLVQTGQISKEFNDKLDKDAGKPEADNSQFVALKEFKNKAFAQRKKDLNTELLKEIDNYLDLSQDLSDQQLWNLLSQQLASKI